MDLWTAPHRYAEALLLAKDVSEAASRTLGGPRFEEALKAPLVKTLLDDGHGWAWADNSKDLDLIAGGALTETVDFVCRRHALAVPVVGEDAPSDLWPDLADRLRLLHEALVFAASVAEDAWPCSPRGLLAQWIRERLAVLVAPTEGHESLAALEARLRHAVVLCHRYRQVCYQLFGDRMWTGRPTGRWWCPDLDLAARAPFHDFGKSPRPIQVLRLRTGTARTGSGEMAVQAVESEPASTYRFAETDGRVQLDPSAAVDATNGEGPEELVHVIGEALRALDTGEHVVLLDPRS